MADILGFRTRDRTTGSIIIDITDRLTRVIGTVYSGSSDGSISVPGFSMGAGWAAVLETPESSDNISLDWKYPLVSISGTTLSWVFVGPVGSSAIVVPCYILYGVY